MRIFDLVALACLIATEPAHAAENEVQSGPVPSWATPSQLIDLPANPSGLVFVRRQDYVTHLDGKGSSQYVGYRVRILHPKALELGNISLTWNPMSGPPTVHGIRIYRDEQIIDVLKTANFEILRREGQLEAARLDGNLTAVMRVPDLRVGDEIEFEMTFRQSDPTLGPQDAGLLALGPDPAPGRYHLGLSWDKGQEPRTKLTPDIAEFVQRGPSSIDLRFDNPKALIPPKDAPPRFAWRRVVEFSDFAQWGDIGRHFAPLYSKAAALNASSPIKAEAQRIAAANTTQMARASAALKLVQQEVRYIYVGLNGGNLTPASAEETWQRRYGDCKGKTALLIALLNELGVEAEPVLVNASGADDGLDERLPSPRFFDHVLVRARIDNQWYWLDGTLPPVVPPGVDPVVPYRWILPLTTQGRSIERVAWKPQTRPDLVTLYEIDASDGFGKFAKTTTTTITRGIDGLKQQLELSGVTEDQLLTGMRQAIVGEEWQSVDEVKWHYDPSAQASVLKITGMAKVDWDDDGDGDKSLVLPGGGFIPPDKHFRPADQDQSLPYENKHDFDCRVTTVRLPKTTKASGWAYNKRFDTRLFGREFYRNFEIRDGSLRMIRGTRVEAPELDALAAARDNAKLPAFDNSKAILYYEPSEKAHVNSVTTPVPATYEIDWTADDVPCLGSAAARLAVPSNK